MIYLGLGSNLGERRQFLTAAIEQLRQNGFKLNEISPVVESPALLKANAKPDWNRPYLNLVISGESQLTPHELLAQIKKIECTLGRDLCADTWAPRQIDIDILLWHDERINTPDLTIPHSQLYKRAFVITPLMHLAPHLIIPGIQLSAFQISQNIRPIPLWMGIVNVTPDSFSDGGAQDKLSDLEQMLRQWLSAGVNIVDFGAESTRPNGEAISEQQEWARLEPALLLVNKLRCEHALMPLVSVDTRHVSVAMRALNLGADWINDVSGLEDEKMQVLAQQAQINVVAMHSLSVPVNPELVLEVDKPAPQQILAWIDKSAQSWQDASINLAKIIIDPGIGFGKTPLQNLELIKSSKVLRSHGFRLLMGHSRKSFMRSFSSNEANERDMETVGLSLAMCEQGVDILRVHDPISHMRAYRAWAHATQT